MTARRALDAVTVSISSDTALIPGEPLLIGEGEDLIRLSIGDPAEVTLWIERKEVVRMIGAVVLASQVVPRRPSPTPSAPEPFPETAPFPASEIPF